jgi:phospholipase B1
MLSFILFSVVLSSQLYFPPLKRIIECPSLTPRSTKPTSVRDLRPDDIRVIGAIGDSITAGFGATGLKDVNNPNSISSLFEQRGVAWSIGGDPGALTTANYFRRYNPDLYGYSVGEHLANVCMGWFCPPGQYRPNLDRFNVARSGALVSNLMVEVVSNYVIVLIGRICWSNKCQNQKISISRMISSW